jgi:hypothetical protein
MPAKLRFVHIYRNINIWQLFTLDPFMMLLDLGHMKMSRSQWCINPHWLSNKSMYISCESPSIPHNNITSLYAIYWHIWLKMSWPLHSYSYKSGSYSESHDFSSQPLSLMSALIYSPISALIVSSPQVFIPKILYTVHVFPTPSHH